MTTFSEHLFQWKKKKKQQYDETDFAKTVQESPQMDFYPRLLTKKYEQGEKTIPLDMGKKIQINLSVITD